MTEIFHMPPNLTLLAWGDISRLIAPAVDMAGGRHTLSTTLDRLQSGHMQALVGLEDARPIMACVTQVALYPAQKWLQVPFCGGTRMKDWLEPLVEALDGLAYDNRCFGIEISGRGGWRRVLRKYGYYPDPHHPTLLVRRLDLFDAKRRKVA